MEIWHHVGFGNHDKVDSLLDSLRIAYKRTPPSGDSYSITFDIAESDERWPQIERVAQLKHATNMFDTIFTEAEIRAAEWSRLIPNFERGYPQPEATWSGDPSNYRSRCAACGAGFEQVAPFQILEKLRLIRLIRKDFMCLYWTYALFGTQKVFDLFEAAGVRGHQPWEVLLYESGCPSRVIRQVYMPKTTEPGLIGAAQLKPVRCPQCRESKYSYHKRGYMPYRREALPTDVDMVQSYEWFGSGHEAFREIFVSNKVAKLILDHQLKGVALKPIR